MKKALLAITTYNQTQITMNFLKNFFPVDGVDIVIYDDCSQEDYSSFESERVRVVLKDNGMGLTDSWNRAYQDFKKDNSYDYLIIANNDIIIPNGSLEELFKELDKNTLVVPMSTAWGAGHCGQWQGIERYINVGKRSWNSVQNTLVEMNMDPLPLPKFNGFFFAMNRNICKYEFDSDHLFNPKNINVGNEDDLRVRLIESGVSPILCRKSFVFHFKNQTFKVGTDGIDWGDREKLEMVREKRKA